MRLFFNLTVILLCIECAAAPEPLPDWVDAPVHSSSYWYGTGSGATREIARNSAINEIAQQISVQISSSMTNTILEQNQSVQEITEKIIHARVEDTLPSIEIVDSHSSGGLTYIQCRLKKTIYYEAVARKRQTAVNKALDLLRMADTDFSIHSFGQLSSAMDLIIPYLDASLPVVYPDTSGDVVDLPSLLNEKAAEFHQRIQLTAEPAEFSAVVGLPISQQVIVSCTDSQTGKGIPGIPTSASFPENAITQAATTNQHGKADYRVSRVQSAAVSQSISFQLDHAAIYPQRDDQLLTFLPVVPAIVQVSVRGLRIEMNAGETELGRAAANPVLAPILKSFLIENYNAAFTSANEADISVESRAITRRRTENAVEYYGQLIYQANADYTLKIVDLDTHHELSELNLSGIRGVSYVSFEDASRDALRKLGNRVKNELLPSLKSSLSGEPSR